MLTTSDTSSGSRTTQNPVEGIQYLRGVAALMVVFHHARWILPRDSPVAASDWAQFGCHGVDIFFVISGFVMAHSMRGFDPDLQRVSQAAAFFAKRLIRVVPLYWIAMLWDAKSMIRHEQGLLDLAKDFSFIPHFNDHGHGMIWPHLFQGWTINYEMFFYVLFALSLLVGRRRFVVLSFGLLILAVVGVIARFVHPHMAAIATFYTSSLLVEFLLGVWLQILMDRNKRQLPRPVLVSFALVGLCLLTIQVDDQLRGVVDGLLAALIVWATILASKGTRIVWLQRLGDASYSVYLFHMAIFGAVSWLCRSLHLVGPRPIDIGLVIAIYLGLASAVGLSIHHVVEKPLLKVLRSRFSRQVKPSLGLGAHLVSR